MAAMTDRRANLVAQAAQEEAHLRAAREAMDAALARRNETVRALRADGASYATIAAALGITRAGAVGICRKIDQSGDTAGLG